LGLAPAFDAARVRHASAGRRGGLARDSGIAGAPVAFHDAEIYARVHPATDGDLRQGAPTRMRMSERPVQRITLQQELFGTV